MGGYFGTETQQRLQATVEASRDFISKTPGACEAGRIMPCDDLERLGGDRILGFLERDGNCGFRLISSDKIPGLRGQLAGEGYRLDTWDIFLADAETALAASDRILSAGLPDDLREIPGPTDPEAEYTRQVQLLMSEAGVVPFSGSMLTGEHGPATTVVVGEADGTPVATTHAYLPHNAFSDFRGYAWGGLVAVAESQRGKRLGNYVNAHTVAGAVGDLGATHVRINKPLKVGKWWPVFRAMPQMLKELERAPREETGFLGHNGLSFGAIVQYWRSFDHLERYARSQESSHWPAWVEFNRRMKSSRGDVGIWPETCLVKAGQYEAVSSRMPACGLGRVGELVPATGNKQDARRRLSA